MSNSFPHVPGLYVYSPTNPISTSAEIAATTIRPNALSPIERGHNPAVPSGKSPRRRKHDESHIRRPSNPFILFAAEFRKKTGNEHKSNRQLSKEAGALWRIMPIAEKNVWRNRANEVKEEHTEKYPDYRYQPRRRGAPRHPDCANDTKDNSNIVFMPPVWTPESPPTSSRCSPCKRSKESGAYNTNPSFSSSAICDHGTHPSSSLSTRDSCDELDPELFENLRRSLLLTEPATGPSYKAPQIPSVPYTDDTLHLSFPLAEPGQVPAPRIDYELRATSNNVSYGAFDQPIETRANGASTNKHPSNSNSTVDIENDPFFNMFQFHEETYHSATSSLYDPTYSSFL